MSKLCMDIGGTNTRIAEVNNGKIIKIKKFNTLENFKDQVKKIISTIEELNFSFKEISFSAPGPANYKTGVFGKLPNLPNWENQNLKKSLEQYFKNIRVTANNDANLMALAHHMYFNNQSGITQFFTISTGFGGGLIINNKIFKGTNGTAQEIAAVPAAFEKLEGKKLPKGSLELFAAGSGIEYRLKMKAVDAFKLYGSNKQVTKVINEGIDALANIIATVVAIINPNLLVFDGSVAMNNKWYVKKAINLAETRMLQEQKNYVKYEFSKLGDNSALIGAYYV